jgi:hypothetical protein
MPDDVNPVFSDSVQIGSSPFGVSLLFTMAPNPTKGQQVPTVVADVRMSPEHAKVLAIILRRHMLDYEQQLGRPLPIHPNVMKQLGLSPEEDW